MVKYYLIDFIAFLIFILLIISLLIPWPINETRISSQTDITLNKISFNNNIIENDDNDSPNSLAILFGYKINTNPSQNINTKERNLIYSEPIPLKYFGYITTEKGETKYFFKDLKSNEIIELYLNKPNRFGDSLVSITNNGYTVNYKGKIYNIPRF